MNHTGILYDDGKLGGCCRVCGRRFEWMGVEEWRNCGGYYNPDLDCIEIGKRVYEGRDKILT